MNHWMKRPILTLGLTCLALHAMADVSETKATQTSLPIEFRPAFCGDADNALRNETAAHELSQAYSTALLMDLQHREKTQARSTRDALADMLVEYCPGRRDGK